MSALTVTLGADITALKRAMAGATELVGASARRISKLTGAGLTGRGKGGAAALSKEFSGAGVVIKAGIGAALAGDRRWRGVTSCEMTGHFNKQHPSSLHDSDG